MKICYHLNMKKVALFEKVSKSQFALDCPDFDVYESLKLPKRATIGSAGYDFFSPFDFSLKAHETIKIPTGIRVLIDEGYFLQIFPRSSLGFKYKLQLDNTVGIIDSDYSNAKNEGHIMIKITNNSENELVIKQNEAFAQGIFTKFYITYDDEVGEERIGGFGSTNKNND